jgi:cyclopropane fatty-acyl-phospholipid synthase-like methyltransferase
MANSLAKQFRKPSGFGGRIVSFVMKKGNRSEYEKLIPELDIRKGDHLLEIGFGHGIGIEMICGRYDCSYTGVDFSALMFKEASARNKSHIDSGKVSLKFGDYLEVVNPPESFDKVFFINVSYFWPDLAKPFHKIHNELKPGGMVCLYMSHSDDIRRLRFTSDEVFRKYTIEDMREGLINQGFHDFSYIYDRGYYIKCRK